MKLNTQPLKDKRITAPIAITWILMTWVSILAMPSVFLGNKIPAIYYQLKACALITLYILVGLYVDDKKDDYEKIFSTIWRTDKLVDDPKLCLSMIKEALDLNNEVFADVWNKWDKAVQERKTNVGVRNKILTKETLQNRSKEAINKIFHGTLEMKDIIWIFIYNIYIYIFSTNLMKLNAPLDYLASLGFYLILVLTNETKGLGIFLKELSDDLLNIEDSQIETTLRVVRDKIITLSHTYFLVEEAIGRVEQQFTPKKEVDK